MLRCRPFPVCGVLPYLGLVRRSPERAPSRRKGQTGRTSQAVTRKGMEWHVMSGLKLKRRANYLILMLLMLPMTPNT